MIVGIIGGVLIITIAALNAASAPVWTFVATAFIWFLWTLIALGVEGRRSRNRLRWLGTLMPLPYHAAMRRVLDTLPRLLLPRTAEAKPKPENGLWAKLAWSLTPRARDAADLERLRRGPWSWPVADAALRIALVYPLAFGIVQWTLGGGGTGLGDIALFPGDTPTWLRWATLCLVATLIAVASYVIIFQPFSFGAGDRLVLYMLVAAGALAVAGAESGAIVAPLAGAFATATPGAGGGAVALALALAAALAAAVALPAEGLGAAAAAFALTPVATLTAAAFALLSTRRGIGLFGYALFVACGIAASAWAATVSPQDSTALIWIVGLTLLPLVNAVFDWLSYGLTMWLLTTGHRRRGPWPLLLGIADAGAALVLFILLSLALMGILGLVNALRAAPLVDLRALLDGIAARPEDHLWVVAMVASTLLPTFLHLCLAFLSLAGWFPDRLWTRWVDALGAEDDGHAPLGATVGLLGLSLFWVALITAPIGGAVWALWTHGGTLREGYVHVLSNVGGWIGIL